VADTVPSFEEIMKVQNRAIEMQIQDWIHNDLFSYQFWLLIMLLVVPWFVWWKLVDRKRHVEILLYGLLVATLVTIIDELGAQLNLWEYPIDIEPLFPRMIPINLTVFPVIYMFIYQYFSKWKSFLIANVALAAVLSFIAENIFEWLGIYELIKWENYYSFPIYIIVALFLKWLMKLILTVNIQ
jgi:hypothetical protein